LQKIKGFVAMGCKLQGQACALRLEAHGEAAALMRGSKPQRGGHAPLLLLLHLLRNNPHTAHQQLRRIPAHAHFNRHVGCNRSRVDKRGSQAVSAVEPEGYDRVPAARACQWFGWPKTARGC